MDIGLAPTVMMVALALHATDACPGSEEAIGKAALDAWFESYDGRRPGQISVGTLAVPGGECHQNRRLDVPSGITARTQLRPSPRC
ncbi:MAG: hypothetical protein HN742_30695 [Lentisphaerae bacterium]|nr:hypothetical protein [Lentisphaerota bacterium]MBT4820472.1 hypothetical protein [Lentisphaerota bacterium]MBT5606326.1 hypothetical protein [Lentisphaerota bacterium]MBT7059606.1 hypothetical protein [Lentisphaerota bacterium]MBT7846280.1 hypothetical protein [Lentisphaerota bacterium]